jgi:hypothetical protein
MVQETTEAASAPIGHPTAEDAGPNWRDGLTHKDWLFDGRPIRGGYAIDRFNRLDWSKAWVDLGPSIAGNLGPYWHVPMDDGDTVHRLYPKVLKSKWLLVIRQACEECRAKTPQ